MNIFHKVALEGLKKSRTRTGATIVGVALSTALFTAVTTFAISLQSYMMNGAIVKYGGWHVAFSDVSGDFCREQKQDDRVEDIALFENIGYALLEGGVNPDKPYLFLAGFQEQTFEALPLELLSGRLPENDSEILVPAHVASNGGVKFSLGDTIALQVGSRSDGEKALDQHTPYLSGETFLSATQKTYTVVGICERPGFEETTAPGYTLITRSDKNRDTDSVSAFITLKNPFSVRNYMKDLSEEYGCVCILNDYVLRFLGISGDQTFNMILCSIGIVLMALIMLGSVFLIYNSFTISLNERVHQFGILLSIGATERQIRNAVLFEGLCIGLVAIPIGVVAGVPMIGLVLALVSENFKNVMYDNVPLVLKISVPAIVTAAVFGMSTILLSAYLPARKAAAVPVMDCIRQTRAVEIRKRDVKIPKIAARVFGLEGTIAWKNFRRNAKRYRSIILSLMLSVVLYISASSFAADLQLLTEQVVVDMEGDILFWTQDMEEKEFLQLYDELKGVNGVRGSNCDIAAVGRKEKGTQPCMTFWSDTPGQTREKMQALIDGAGITVPYTLSNIHEKLEGNRNMLFIVKLFSVFFTLMITLIATVNVFNTISTNIRLRRRELAMLRSVGMSDREFGRMMRFECLLYGWRTLLFGLPVAGLCSWAIYMVMIGMEGRMDIAFRFPWSSIGISIVGVFLVIFITMLYTVSKIRRENIIEALRDDMS